MLPFCSSLFVLFAHVCRLEITMDSASWSDAARFPCKMSFYQPSMPACDFFFHGWQTKDGDSRAPKMGLLDAQCCPEGVVRFAAQQVQGTCNARLSDSPWRIKYVSNSAGTSMSTVEFALEFANVGSQLSSDCGSTPVDEVKLYINPGRAAALQNVLVDSKSVPVIIKNDPSVYVSIDTAGFVNGTSITLQFFSKVRGVTEGIDICGTYLWDT